MAEKKSRATVAKRLYLSETGEKAPITEATHLQLEFADSEKTKMVLSLADFGALPEVGIPRALFAHGLSQKVGDAFAGIDGDVEKAVVGAEAIIESLLDGCWNVSRTSGGVRSTDLVLALMDYRQSIGKPFTADEARAFIAKKKAEGTNVALAKDIASRITALQAARREAKVVDTVEGLDD